MAAKKLEATEQAPALETKPEEKPHGKPLPKLGDIVYFYKNIQTQTGNKVEEFAAMVIGYPRQGTNFQKKDMALDLKVFTCRDGGSDEVKHGVVYSETKTAQRWSYKH